MGHCYTDTAPAIDTGSHSFKIQQTDELAVVRGKGWRCVAGPFTLPHEVTMVEHTIKPLVDGAVSFGVFNISRFGNVVEVWRKPAPQAQPRL